MRISLDNTYDGTTWRPDKWPVSLPEIATIFPILRKQLKKLVAGDVVKLVRDGKMLLGLASCVSVKPRANEITVSRVDGHGERNATLETYDLRKFDVYGVIAPYEPTVGVVDDVDTTAAPAKAHRTYEVFPITRKDYEPTPSSSPMSEWISRPERVARFSDESMMRLKLEARGMLGRIADHVYCEAPPPAEDLAEDPEEGVEGEYTPHDLSLSARVDESLAFARQDADYAEWLSEHRRRQGSKHARGMVNPLL